MSANKLSLTTSVAAKSSKVYVRNKPFDIARAALLLGSEEAAIALSESLKDPHCSKEGLSVILEVMHGVASGMKLEPYCYRNDRHPKYSFSTRTTIENDYFENSSFELILVFSPEFKLEKKNILPDSNGSYFLDLKIVFRVIGKAPDEFGGGLILECPVVVEFDGNSHLADEQVRRDKIRDSIMQREGVYIFRIQSPYMQNKSNYEQELKKLIDFHVVNIKCLLWNKLNIFIMDVEAWNRKCHELLIRRAELKNISAKTVSRLERF